MDEFLRSMTYPFVACLLLAGMHVYLGIHVIERKVIFVDLALAQIAAFGALYGILLGYELREDPWAIRGFSLAFAIIGAAVFSLTRTKRERIPQEAIIGITYAVALAASILASAHLPHGAEDMRELLAGSILWVRGETLVYLAILYAVIGAFHYAFRHRFLLISMQPERAMAQGVRVRLWDFLFYISFGFVVTNSVAIAGVLLVFSYLVIPAVVAVLFAGRIGPRLLIGWAVGTSVSFFGVVFSYVKDLPSGPTIVVSFAAFLVAAGIVHYVTSQPTRARPILRVLAGGVVFVGLLASSLLFRKHDQHGPVEMLGSPLKNERLIALRAVAEDAEAWEQASSAVYNLLDDPEAEVRLAALKLATEYREPAFLPKLRALLGDSDDTVRETVVRALRLVEDREGADALAAAAEGEADDFIRVEMGETLLEFGDPRGIAILIDVMDHGGVPHVRKDAHEHLTAHIEVDFYFRADVPVQENDIDVNRFRQWWLENRNNLSWQDGSGVFVVREPSGASHGAKDF